MVEKSIKWIKKRLKKVDADLKVTFCTYRMLAQDDLSPEDEERMSREVDILEKEVRSLELKMEFEKKLLQA